MGVSGKISINAKARSFRFRYDSIVSVPDAMKRKNKQHRDHSPWLDCALIFTALVAAGLVGHLCFRLGEERFSPPPVDSPSRLTRAAIASPQAEALSAEDMPALQLPAEEVDTGLPREGLSQEEPFHALRHHPRVRWLLDAMRVVESGGQKWAVGDGGRSRGPYQITRLHWRDAMKQGGVDWEYNLTAWHGPAAESAILWYWQRYCPTALEQLTTSDNAGAVERACEHLARVHNGGPRGYRKASTYRYWRRIRIRLNQPR